MTNVFNKPDRKAKRYRKKTHVVVIYHVMVAIRKKFPQYKHKVTEKDCRYIISNFCTYMKNKVLENRDGVELPEGLGYIMLTSYKSKKKLINKGESEKHQIKIYQTNLEIDGFKAKVMYTNDKMKYTLLNRDMWRFNGARSFRIDVSSTFRKNWKKFIQLEMGKKICRKIERNIRYVPLFDPETTYNEFDI